MAPSDQLEYQKTAIRDLIANTKPEQLDNPSPCSTWTARDVINHMVGGGTIFGAALKGQPAEIEFSDPMPDLMGDDAVAAWERAAAAFSEGVDSPGALERDVDLPFGTVPGSVLLEIAKFDLLVHGWDLAQATDQAFDPPPDVVEPALQAAHTIIAPEARDGVTFAPEVPAPADATPIQRLAAFTGRTV